MVIRKNIYSQLLFDSPPVPPETGGILGGKNGIIEDLFFDNHKGLTDRAIYVPNVEMLNRQIALWNTCGIRLYGIFHTHPLSSEGLSDADIEYINIIMKGMPDTIRELYFPIVYPKKEIKAFRATRKGSIVMIEPDKVVLT